MNKQKRLIFTVAWIFALASITDVCGDPQPIAKSFKVSEGGNLVVDVERAGADVSIDVWAKSEVAVRAEGISERDAENLKIEQEGTTINVLYYADDGWRSHRNIRFNISVPSRFNLDIETSGGDVDVSGAIQGTVSLATAGGDIEIDDVNGEVELKTAGGDIEAGNVQGDVKLKTAGGDIDIGDVGGGLEASTAGGDITTGEIKKDLEASTAGGDIKCKNVGGEADVETSGGGIELGVVRGNASAETAGGDIEIMGATGRALAKTAGGDIELTKISGTAKAATAGGDIYVELDPSNADDSSMETKGGDVKLLLPARAKATVDATIRLRDWGSRDTERYDIISDFKAESHDRNDREVRAKYVINGGGKVITLETVNGNIEIRKQ